jgi:hypothetical protein
VFVVREFSYLGKSLERLLLHKFLRKGTHFFRHGQVLSDKSAGNVDFVGV